MFVLSMVIQAQTSGFNASNSEKLTVSPDFNAASRTWLSPPFASA